jgi:hypothetical protein
MELKLTKDVIQALKYNPTGPETQQVWEGGQQSRNQPLSPRQAPVDRHLHRHKGTALRMNGPLK